MRTENEIVLRVEQLEERHGEFHRTCRHLRRFWQGHMWADQDQMARSLATVFRDLRHGTSEDRQPDVKVTVPNVEAVTSKWMALLSEMPQINMLTPPVGFAGLRKEETVQALADQNERYLYGTWEQNRANRHFKRQSFYLPLMGCCFIGAHPDFDKKNVKYLTRSPEISYPVWDENHEYLEELFFKWEVPIEVAIERWGEKVARYLSSVKQPGLLSRVMGREIESRRTVDVIEHYDKDSKTTLVGGYKVAGIQHDLSYTPWSMSSFYDVPDEDFGKGVIEGNVGLFMEINMLDSLRLQSVIENVFPKLVLENPALAPELIDNSAGAILPIGAGGKAYYLEPPGVTRDLDASIGRAMDSSQRSTHLPASMYGEGVASSITTGKAQHESMAPTGNVVEYVQGNIGDAWEQVNEMTIDLAGKVFANREIKDLYGRQFGQNYIGAIEPTKPFVISLQGKDLKGWSRHELVFQPQMDMHEKIVMGLQALGAGLVSKRWNMDQMGITDPQAMKDEILAEQLLEIKLAAWTQAVTGGTMTADQVEQNFVAMAAGKMPPFEPGQVTTGMPGQVMPGMPPGAPPMPPGAGPVPPGAAPPVPPMGGGGANPMLPPAQGPGDAQPPAGIPQPPPQDQGRFSLEGAIGDFQNVKKVKGRVFLIGEIVQRGSTDGPVEVAITMRVDKQTILNGLPDDYHGNIQFQDVAGEPKEAHVEVTPGHSVTPGGGPLAPHPDQVTAQTGGLTPLDQFAISPGGHRNPPEASNYPQGGFEGSLRS